MAEISTPNKTQSRHDRRPAKKGDMSNPKHFASEDGGFVPQAKDIIHAEQTNILELSEKKIESQREADPIVQKFEEQFGADLAKIVEAIAQDSRENPEVVAKQLKRDYIPWMLGVYGNTPEERLELYRRFTKAKEKVERSLHGGKERSEERERRVSATTKMLLPKFLNAGLSFIVNRVGLGLPALKEYGSRWLKKRWDKKANGDEEVGVLKKTVESGEFANIEEAKRQKQQAVEAHGELAEAMRERNRTNNELSNLYARVQALKQKAEDQLKNAKKIELSYQAIQGVGPDDEIKRIGDAYASAFEDYQKSLVDYNEALAEYQGKTMAFENGDTEAGRKYLDAKSKMDEVTMGRKKVAVTESLVVPGGGEKERKCFVYSLSGEKILRDESGSVFSQGENGELKKRDDIRFDQGQFIQKQTLEDGKTVEVNITSSVRKEFKSEASKHESRLSLDTATRPAFFKAQMELLRKHAKMMETAGQLDEQARQQMEAEIEKLYEAGFSTYESWMQHAQHITRSIPFLESVVALAFWGKGFKKRVELQIKKKQTLEQVSQEASMGSRKLGKLAGELAKCEKNLVAYGELFEKKKGLFNKGVQLKEEYKKFEELYDLRSDEQGVGENGVKNLGIRLESIQKEINELAEAADEGALSATEKVQLATLRQEHGRLDRILTTKKEVLSNSKEKELYFMYAGMRKLDEAREELKRAKEELAQNFDPKKKKDLYQKVGSCERTVAKYEKLFDPKHLENLSEYLRGELKNSGIMTLEQDTELLVRPHSLTRDRFVGELSSNPNLDKPKVVRAIADKAKQSCLAIASLLTGGLVQSRLQKTQKGFAAKALTGAGALGELSAGGGLALASMAPVTELLKDVRTDGFQLEDVGDLFLKTNVAELMVFGSTFNEQKAKLGEQFDQLVGKGMSEEDALTRLQEVGAAPKTMTLENIHDIPRHLNIKNVDDFLKQVPDALAYRAAQAGNFNLDLLGQAKRIAATAEVAVHKTKDVIDAGVDYVLGEEKASSVLEQSQVAQAATVESGKAKAGSQSPAEEVFFRDKVYGMMPEGDLQKLEALKKEGEYFKSLSETLVKGGVRVNGNLEKAYLQLIKDGASRKEALENLGLDQYLEIVNRKSETITTTVVEPEVVQDGEGGKVKNEGAKINVEDRPMIIARLSDQKSAMDRQIDDMLTQLKKEGVITTVAIKRVEYGQQIQNLIQKYVKKGYVRLDENAPNGYVLTHQRYSEYESAIKDLIQQKAQLDGKDGDAIIYLKKEYEGVDTKLRQLLDQRNEVSKQLAEAQTALNEIDVERKYQDELAEVSRQREAAELKFAEQASVWISQLDKNSKERVEFEQAELEYKQALAEALKASQHRGGPEHGRTGAKTLAEQPEQFVTHEEAKKRLEYTSQKLQSLYADQGEDVVVARVRDAGQKMQIASFLAYNKGVIHAKNITEYVNTMVGPDGKPVEKLPNGEYPAGSLPLKEKYGTLTDEKEFATATIERGGKQVRVMDLPVEEQLKWLALSEYQNAQIEMIKAEAGDQAQRNLDLIDPAVRPMVREVALYLRERSGKDYLTQAGGYNGKIDFVAARMKRLLPQDITDEQWNEAIAEVKKHAPERLKEYRELLEDEGGLANVPVWARGKVRQESSPAIVSETETPSEPDQALEKHLSFLEAYSILKGIKIVDDEHGNLKLTDNGMSDFEARSKAIEYSMARTSVPPELAEAHARLNPKPQAETQKPIEPTVQTVERNVVKHVSIPEEYQHKLAITQQLIVEMLFKKLNLVPKRPELPTTPEPIVPEIEIIHDPRREMAKQAIADAREMTQVVDLPEAAAKTTDFRITAGVIHFKDFNQLKLEINETLANAKGVFPSEAQSITVTIPGQGAVEVWNPKDGWNQELLSQPGVNSMVIHDGQGRQFAFSRDTMIANGVERTIVSFQAIGENAPMPIEFTHVMERNQATGEVDNVFRFGRTDKPVEVSFLGADAGLIDKEKVMQELGKWDGNLDSRAFKNFGISIIENMVKGKNLDTARVKLGDWVFTAENTGKKENSAVESFVKIENSQWSLKGDFSMRYRDNKFDLSYGGVKISGMGVDDQHFAETLKAMDNPSNFVNMLDRAWRASGSGSMKMEIDWTKVSDQFDVAQGLDRTHPMWRLNEILKAVEGNVGNRVTSLDFGKILENNFAAKYGIDGGTKSSIESSWVKQYGENYQGDGIEIVNGRVVSADPQRYVEFAQANDSKFKILDSGARHKKQLDMLKDIYQGVYGRDMIKDAKRAGNGIAEARARAFEQYAEEIWARGEGNHWDIQIGEGDYSEVELASVQRSIYSLNYSGGDANTKYTVGFAYEQGQATFTPGKNNDISAMQGFDVASARAAIQQQFGSAGFLKDISITASVEAGVAETRGDAEYIVQHNGEILYAQKGKGPDGRQGFAIIRLNPKTRLPIGEATYVSCGATTGIDKVMLSPRVQARIFGGNAYLEYAGGRFRAGFSKKIGLLDVGVEALNLKDPLNSLRAHASISAGDLLGLGKVPGLGKVRDFANNIRGGVSLGRKGANVDVSLFGKNVSAGTGTLMDAAEFVGGKVIGKGIGGAADLLADKKNRGALQSAVENAVFDKGYHGLIDVQTAKDSRELDKMFGDKTWGEKNIEKARELVMRIESGQEDGINWKHIREQLTAKGVAGVQEPDNRFAVRNMLGIKGSVAEVNTRHGRSVGWNVEVGEGKKGAVVVDFAGDGNMKRMEVHVNDVPKDLLLKESGIQELIVNQKAREKLGDDFVRDLWVVKQMAEKGGANSEHVIEQLTARIATEAIKHRKLFGDGDFDRLIESLPNPTPKRRAEIMSYLTSGGQAEKKAITNEEWWVLYKSTNKLNSAGQRHVQSLLEELRKKQSKGMIVIPGGKGGTLFELTSFFKAIDADKSE